MTDQVATLFSRLFQTAELLPHSVDMAQKKIKFLHMSEKAYRDSSFLDERAQVQTYYDVSLDNILDNYRRARALSGNPVHLVLYNGYCGSTLLTRYLYDLPGYHVVREPKIMHWLSEVKAESLRERNPETQEVVRLIHFLLTRQWNNNPAMFIKVPSVCTVIAEDLLSLHPDSTAICLYAGKQEFLSSYLKKESRRNEALLFYRALSSYSSQVGLLDSSLPDASEDDLSVAQCVAGLWMMYQALFSRLCDRFPGGRVYRHDSDVLFSQPETVLRAIVERTGVSVSEDHLREVISGDVATSYSKNPGREFSVEQRDHEIRAQQIQYRDEIEEGLAFIHEYSQ